MTRERHTNASSALVQSVDVSVMSHRFQLTGISFRGMHLCTFDKKVTKIKA